MSPLEGSILASLGRWFCCCCLSWSLLLSTHQSGPKNANSKKKKVRKLCRVISRRILCPETVLPDALTPNAFPSNTWASAETAGCSQCPLGWQQFPDWSLHITEITGVWRTPLVHFGRRQRFIVSLCLPSHLWWKSPCLGNCTCTAVAPPSSSCGSWWGPGPTGVSPVTLPSPPLWTAGSLKQQSAKKKKKLSATQMFTSREFPRAVICYILKSMSILPKPCLMYCGIVRMHDTL